jgi:hypothetical protein
MSAGRVIIPEPTSCLAVSHQVAGWSRLFMRSSWWIGGNKQAGLAIQQQHPLIVQNTPQPASP